MDKPQRIGYAILDIFMRRLPDQREAILLLIACAFSVNIWSIFNVLRVMPSFLPRFRVDQIIYLISYTQAYALLESLTVWLSFIVLCIIFPRNVLRDGLAAKGTVIVAMTSLWAIAFHYLFEISIFFKNSISYLFKIISISSNDTQVQSIAFYLFVVLWILIYISGLFIGLKKLIRKPQFGEKVYRLLARLEVLTLIYLIVDVLGLLIVVIRNV